MARTPRPARNNADRAGRVQDRRVRGSRWRAPASLLLLAVLIEPLEEGPEIVDLLGILEAHECHPGAGQPLHWIGDVFLEGGLVPGDPRALVGVGIVEAF